VWSWYLFFEGLYRGDITQEDDGLYYMRRAVSGTRRGVTDVKRGTVNYKVDDQDTLLKHVIDMESKSIEWCKLAIEVEDTTKKLQSMCASKCNIT